MRTGGRHEIMVDTNNSHEACRGGMRCLGPSKAKHLRALDAVVSEWMEGIERSAVSGRQGIPLAHAGRCFCRVLLERELQTSRSVVDVDETCTRPR